MCPDVFGLNLINENLFSIEILNLKIRNWSGYKKFRLNKIVTHHKRTFLKQKIQCKPQEWLVQPY